MTEDCADTGRLSDIARECFCIACCHSTLVMPTRLVIQSGAFAAITCFPCGRSRLKRVLVVSTLKQSICDVLENLFLDFVTCSKNFESTFAVVSPRSCMLVTRLALYCVCDRENFMKLRDCLVLEQCPWHPERDVSVLLVVVWK